MLSLRHQLPAYSPIRFAALAASLGGALGFGRPRARLEARLADEYAGADVVLTDSGTTALRLAMQGALGTRGHDTVALPAYCCYDVVTAAVGAGAGVRLYDVDPETLGPDWPSLEQALRAGAGAVVAVHLYGIPVDMSRLAELAAAHGALVIDDAAQGFGGSVDGRRLGAFGSLGVLSFGRGKGITGGGGGALLANDEQGRRALDAVRSLPAGGRPGWSALLKLTAQWMLGRPSVYGIPSALPWLGLGETRYREPWPPCGISRSAAAALLANWDASLDEAVMRRRTAEAVRSGLGDGVAAPRSPDRRATPGALRQPLVRDGDTGWLRRDAAVRAGLQRGYPELRDLPALAAALAGGGAYPGAARLVAALWTAPTHSRSRPAATLAALRDVAGE